MRRHHLFLVLIAVAPVSALLVWRSSPGAPQTPHDKPASDRRPGPNLPLSQIVLFNSGVGYFQREGNIDGDARVDLQFPASDVNDLLKSLVLQDLGNGKVTAISYDGLDPIEHTLRTLRGNGQ